MTDLISLCATNIFRNLTYSILFSGREPTPEPYPHSLVSYILLNLFCIVRRSPLSRVRIEGPCHLHGSQFDVQVSEYSRSHGVRETRELSIAKLAGAHRTRLTRIVLA